MKKSAFPTITESEWQRISSIFSKPQNIMPHALGVQSGIKFSLARAFLISLSNENLASIRTCVYHGCVECPVDITEDYPAYIPYICPNCEEEVTSPKELSYDITAITTAPILFE
jgi:hypothetical protein